MFSTVLRLTLSCKSFDALFADRGIQTMMFRSTLVSEVCQSPDEDEETDRNLLRSDFLINSIPPAAISEAMQICRSDGLVSKVRNNMSKTHLTKNQVTVSV